MEVALSNSLLLKSMIFDFIDIAKITKGQFEIINNEFLLDDVIEDMKNIFKNQLKIKDMSFKVINNSKN